MCYSWIVHNSKTLTTVMGLLNKIESASPCTSYSYNNPLTIDIVLLNQSASQCTSYSYNNPLTIDMVLLNQSASRCICYS